MNKHIIKTNAFLKKKITAYYSGDYHPGNRRTVTGTIENTICTLKNDITPYSNIVLQNAVKQLENILLKDLPTILSNVKLDKLTVCVVPRAKVKYNSNQLLFKTTIKNVVNQLDNFDDATDYIIRHTDTRTTHRDRAGFGGNGKMPYPGITTDTCNISTDVASKDILLIDDLYTKSIDINEDAIQCLLDNGANSVYLYTIGRTI